MELSSPRFKALAVTAGASLWFFIIISAIGFLSVELFLAFAISLFIITQIFAKKLSKGLNVFATINTKIFLGALYVFVISLYGIFFKFLRIDLLRLKKTKTDTYWLEMESLKSSRDFKQY
jgi:hypothetical protein